MSDMTVLWLVIAVLMAVIEATTVQMVSIWFALGALSACVTTLFTGDVATQIVVFVAVSGLALIVTRPMVKRIKVKKSEATNADRYIGKQGVVIDPIDNENAKGLVKVGTSTWSARSLDGQLIDKGKPVTVCAIEGVKLIVKP